MSKKWNGKSKGGVLGYSFFILLTKYSNIIIVYFFLNIVAFYFLLFSNKKSINFYYKNIHGFNKIKRIKSIYNNYVLFGQILIDKVIFLIGKHSKFTFFYEGENYLHEMSEAGKGGMLIGAHMGNWEIAGGLLNRIETKVNIVLLDEEEQKIKTMFDIFGIKRNFNIIAIKDDLSHLEKIKHAFAKNEFIVMYSDRYLDENSTVIIDFFGQPAKFPTGPLYIASKYGVPVSFVFTIKEKKFQYHFYATKPMLFKYPAKLKTRKEDLKNMVKVYSKNLEKMVKKYPNQWFNYFPYWEAEKI